MTVAKRFADKVSSVFVDKMRKLEVPWGPLGYVTYKRTYSRLRHDLGRTEEWVDTVERNCNAILQYGGQFTVNEIETAFEYIYNLKCSPPGRMLWQLGTSTVDRVGGDSLCNCFSKETKFFVSGKIVTFEDAEGLTVQVLTADKQNKWAVVKNYGKQWLTRITLKVPGQSKFRKVIRATANHRWLLADGTETTELKVGDRIKATPSNSRIEDNRAFCHGIIFGDGTRNSIYPNRFTVRLCGAKAAYLQRQKTLYPRTA